jgi:uncharacterized protein YjgD (DUF1641 family)
METPQVEEIVTLATNSFDAWASKVQDEGVDINERIDLLLPLLLKLTNPKFIHVVEKLTDKSDMLDQAIDMGEEFPKVLSTGVNTLDAWAMNLTEQGVDINERIDTLIPLVVKLTDPKFLKVAEKLTSKTDLLEQALDAGEELPKLISTGVNTLDGIAKRLQDADVDIDERLENIVTIMNILTSSNMAKFLEFFSHHVDRFLHLGEIFVDANKLNEKFATFLEDATKSLVETTESSPAPIGGVFGMLKVLKDKDVSRTLGFGVELARKLGRNIAKR